MHPDVLPSSYIDYSSDYCKGLKMSHDWFIFEGMLIIASARSSLCEIRVQFIMIYAVLLIIIF